MKLIWHFVGAKTMGPTVWLGAPEEHFAWRGGNSQWLSWGTL